MYESTVFSQDKHLHFRHQLLTGSNTVKRNFSQDQYARETSHRINMQEEILTESTCKRNFSQNQHARGTSDLLMVVLA